MRIVFFFLIMLSIDVCLISGPLLNAQIPSILIHTEQEILDEPKVPGTFIFTDIDGTTFSSIIGIEIRGGFSQSFPKKTYDIEFWNDTNGSETKDVQFGELREDDDWVLDAMFNEPLRINSFITHKLWLEMNQLYYADQKPKAKPGADVLYVEVTMNNVFQGIYLLSEQVDRKLLKLKKNSNSEIRGELYKAYDSDDATFFNAPDEETNNESNTWSGYEYKYPSDIIDWSNVEELVDFVANSSDEDFIEEIEERFDFNNLMDYFILLNVARILDNRGKNIYLCRYDKDEPYFLTPWDLDGSWGLLWNGNNDSKTQGALSNNLFDRIISTDAGDFRQRISKRWNDLRKTILSDDALTNRINEANQFLLDNQVYEREESVWDYEYSENALNYMLGWVDDRLDFLDKYFNNITKVEHTISSPFPKVYPNPAKEYIIASEMPITSKRIEIYNVFGDKMLETNDMGKEIMLSIEDFSPGLYILIAGEFQSLFYKI